MDSINTGQAQWQVTAKYIVTNATFFESDVFASQKEAVKALQMMVAFCGTVFISDLVSSSIIFSLHEVGG